jgi:hypothetical protein
MLEDTLKQLPDLTSMFDFKFDRAVAGLNAGAGAAVNEGHQNVRMPNLFDLEGDPGFRFREDYEMSKETQALCAAFGEMHHRMGQSELKKVFKIMALDAAPNFKGWRPPKDLGNNVVSDLVVLSSKIFANSDFISQMADTVIWLNTHMNNAFSYWRSRVNAERGVLDSPKFDAYEAWWQTERGVHVPRHDYRTFLQVIHSHVSILAMCFFAVPPGQGHEANAAAGLR